MLFLALVLQFKWNTLDFQLGYNKEEIRRKLNSPFSKGILLRVLFSFRKLNYAHPNHFVEQTESGANISSKIYFATKFLQYSNVTQVSGANQAKSKSCSINIPAAFPECQNFLNKCPLIFLNPKKRHQVAFTCHKSYKKQDEKHITSHWKKWKVLRKIILNNFNPVESESQERKAFSLFNGWYINHYS